MKEIPMFVSPINSLPPMAENSDPFIVFRIGFVAFTLLIAVLTASPLLGTYPNLSLLFGLGSINAKRLVHIPPTSRLWKRAAWAVPALSFLMWAAVKLFWRTPLWAGLALLGPIAALLVLFRYFQLAMELDQRGISETARVNVIPPEPDPDDLTSVFPLAFRYVYANGIDSGLQLDSHIAIPLEAKTAALRVTYLEDQPLVHRIELERLPKNETVSLRAKKPSRKAWKSKIPQSGAARELIPRALEEFVRAAPVGGFIIFSHPEKTQAFVQFLITENSLMLDFPLILQAPETPEFARARQFFAERHLEIEKSGSQAFPYAPDQVEQASRLALDIFEWVFLMDGETILKAEADT